MRTADGRVFIFGHEYHKVPCSICGEKVLAPKRSERACCEDCEPLLTSEKDGRQDFSRNDRNWRRTETSSRKAEW